LSRIVHRSGGAVQIAPSGKPQQRLARAVEGADEK